MMKKGNLNLDELQVSSFTTNLSNKKEETVKGGSEPLQSFNCPPTQNGLCTFDACFSKGPGCSDWQVC